MNRTISFAILISLLSASPALARRSGRSYDGQTLQEYCADKLDLLQSSLTEDQLQGCHDEYESTLVDLDDLGDLDDFGSDEREERSATADGGDPLIAEDAVEEEPEPVDPLEELGLESFDEPEEEEEDTRRRRRRRSDEPEDDDDNLLDDPLLAEDDADVVGLDDEGAEDEERSSRRRRRNPSGNSSRSSLNTGDLDEIPELGGAE